jgi:hypothetical protein
MIDQLQLAEVKGLRSYIFPNPKQNTTAGNQGRGMRARSMPMKAQTVKLAMTQIVI